MNVLITGGASGLGEAITLKLAQQTSIKLYFTYNSSKENTLLIENKYSNTKGIYCDFKNSEEVRKLLELISELDLDVLINNAYTNYVTPQHFNKIDIKTFSNNFQNNLIPLIQITQQSISIFKKKKFGKIINILSAYLINKPPIGLSEYTASKAYIASLSKSWATEGIKYNITSNSISPSFMLTDMNKETDERIIENLKAVHPLKNLLTTVEVAEAVLFFVKCSQQINSTNLIINAGADAL